jgi:hypothetical protein
MDGHVDGGDLEGVRAVAHLVGFADGEHLSNVQRLQWSDLRLVVNISDLLRRMTTTTTKKKRPFRSQNRPWSSKCTEYCFL